MKKIYFLSIGLLLHLSLFAQIQKVKLSPGQLDQLHRGYGMFIHFGINTFNDAEWSDGSLPASSYNPTELDCDQWIKVAKEAGFRYVILTTKHHDGFCLWDSKYTNYDVASSPVKTDVVKEVAKACKKYGLKLGLYYSLWDRHEPCYKDTKKYVEYMKNQLTELMTGYGEICELWFDGGWDKPETAWDIPGIYQCVKKLQPNCLITVNHTIGKPENHSKIREPLDYKYGDPIRFFPVDFRIKDPNLARWDDPKFYEFAGKLYYLPFEHTLCLSDRTNWFQKAEVVPDRQADELEELFYWCTANNNVMILDVPPDNKGKIRLNDELRIFELADRLGIRGGKASLPSGPVNLTFNKKITATSSSESNPAANANDYSLETYWTAKDSTASLEINFDKTIVFHRISLFEKEDIKRAGGAGDIFSKIRTFRIKEFELQCFSNGRWNTFYTGDKIGACKIINLPEAIDAQKIRLRIIKSDGFPSICHFAVSKNSTRGIRVVKLNE